MKNFNLSLVAFSMLISIAMAGDWKPTGDHIRSKWADKVTPDNAWREYPRPQLVREQWQNLNGLWNYTVRNKNSKEKRSVIPTEWTGEILVPFCFESSLSGLPVPKKKGELRLLHAHQELWYQRELTIKKTGRQILHFEAVDYITEVYVNGKKIGTHKGGNNPFKFDITEAAVEGKNKLEVRVTDGTAHYQLLGKQRRRAGGIFYTRVSGIWQTVWLENVADTFIDRLKIDTTINPGIIKIKTFAGGSKKADAVKVTVSFKGKEVATMKGKLEETVITIKDAKLWSPNEPNLYDLKIELLSGDKVVDTVKSYTGIRVVGKKRDAEGKLRFTLNGKVIFHLGPLDQGWWPAGLLTPPSADAMRFDIDFIKGAGFNMVRNHIKVRPRLYYAYCDKIGLLVWQDQVSSIPNPRWTRLKAAPGGADGCGWPDKEHDPKNCKHPYKAHIPQDKEWPDEAHEQFVIEYKEMVDSLYNAPSIVQWIPFNEAWGQHRTMVVGRMAVAYDKTRHINIASGGNFFPIGDIVDEHSYPNPGFPMRDERYKYYIRVVGEFGGHGYNVDDKHQWNPKAKKWKYGPKIEKIEELYRRYKLSMSTLKRLKEQGIAGAVYTQTTDIEVEINGLITYDRAVMKIKPEELKKIHAKFYEDDDK